jgi:Mg/Co/Ni transporter MgtE
MSAQEVIEQINALPPEEREEVVNFVREQDATSVATARKQPDWDRIIEEVFDEHDELFRKLAQ